MLAIGLNTAGDALFWNVFRNATSGMKPAPAGAATPPCINPPVPSAKVAPFSPLE